MSWQQNQQGHVYTKTKSSVSFVLLFIYSCDIDPRPTPAGLEPYGLSRDKLVLTSFKASERAFAYACVKMYTCVTLEEHTAWIFLSSHVKPPQPFCTLWVHYFPTSEVDQYKCFSIHRHSRYIQMVLYQNTLYVLLISLKSISGLPC